MHLALEHKTILKKSSVESHESKELLSIEGPRDEVEDTITAGIDYHAQLSKGEGRVDSVPYKLVFILLVVFLGSWRGATWVNA